MGLRSLQDQFPRAIEGARDSVAIFDPEGRPLYVNHAGRLDEIVAQAAEAGDPFARIHPQDRDRVRAEFAEVVHGGEPRRVEFRLATPDGSFRLLQSEGAAVRDTTGKVVAVLCIARNVTRERRDEDELRATIDALFDQAPIGICISDLQSRIRRANARLQHILGYSDEELLTRAVRDVTHEEDRGLVDELHDSLVAGRLDRFAIEKRIVRGDGDLRWVTCYGGIVRPALGAPDFIVEIADDITERKLMEEALRERDELLESIFRYAPIGIAITDRDARFVRVNPRFERMLGYTSEELARLTGWDLIYQDDKEASRRLRDELWSGKREDFTWERRYVRKNGEVLWTQNTVSLMREAGGAGGCAIALIEDISQRKLADAAIHATAEKLQALTRRMVDLQESERRDMARELHDRVGQTLTAMRINMDMIRTRLKEHDDAVIRGRNDDSMELIDSAFKAVENVMYDLRPPMIDEYGLVAPLQWYATRFMERTGVEVEVRGDERWRYRPEVELALFRIAQEALNNVARHARAARVVLELQEAGGQIVMTVEDDGKGFGRDAGRSQEAGYGLVTMRERSEAVGGTFEARSEEGGGTRITVRVPGRP